VVQVVILFMTDCWEVLKASITPLCAVAPAVVLQHHVPEEACGATSGFDSTSRFYSTKMCTSASDMSAPVSGSGTTQGVAQHVPQVQLLLSHTLLWCKLLGPVSVELVALFPLKPCLRMSQTFFWYEQTTSNS
jgi:hypothetical protein